MRLSRQLGFANLILVLTIAAIGAVLEAYNEATLALLGVLGGIVTEIIIDIIDVLREVEQ